MADNDPRLLRGPTQVLRALRWSLQGLVACWRHESSFRLECALFLVFAPLGLWLGNSGVERAMLVSCLLAVLGAEVMNSALEAAADRFGPERHELIGRAKDMGSAAVFVFMMNALLVWALLLVPRLWH